MMKDNMLLQVMICVSGSCVYDTVVRSINGRIFLIRWPWITYKVLRTVHGPLYVYNALRFDHEKAIAPYIFSYCVIIRSNYYYNLVIWVRTSYYMSLFNVIVMTNPCVELNVNVADPKNHFTSMDLLYSGHG